MARTPGEWCERILDGMGFPCKVLQVNSDGSLKLEFEDGFVEDHVPLEEVRSPSKDCENDGSKGAAQEAGSAQVVTDKAAYKNAAPG